MRIEIRLCNEESVFCFKDFAHRVAPHKGGKANERFLLSSHVTVSNAFRPNSSTSIDEFYSFLLVDPFQDFDENIFHDFYVRRKMVSINDVHHASASMCRFIDVIL